MSFDLNSALSGLSLSLQSEVASDAQLRELESLLLLAHQAKLRAALQSIQTEAEVQFAAANAALAKAQEEAQARAKAEFAQAQAKAEFAQAQAEAEAALAAAVALRVEAVAQEPARHESASQEPSMMEAVLEPVTDSVQESQLEQESATISMQAQPEPQTPSAPAASEQPRGPQRSVNSSYASLNAGLNDRLAFVKSLFGGDDHDYQRVVAYLSTLESKSECETFIVEALQPEYDWSACPDVAERFLKLVYARFD
jgi:hypothetical protein